MSDSDVVWPTGMSDQDPCSEIATKLDVHATPLDQALAGTLASYQARLS